MSYNSIKKNLLCALLLTFFFSSHPAFSFDKIVVWGHKLGSHTHSYIHYGFYRAFQHLGYPTYWFDDHDDVSAFDFANSLFLSEGQVDENIPLKSDCGYMIHNARTSKYRDALSPKQFICFQVYTDSVLSVPNLVKLDTCIYYDLPGRCFYMPWATDLLPNEIEEIKKKLPDVVKEPSVYWIGTVGEGLFGNLPALTPFIKACEENGIKFIVPRAATLVTCEDNISFIGISYMAPAIVGKWQQEVGYIPCRIFKNISYGQLGITNSERVFELFEGKIVYNPDTYQLFYDAAERLKTFTIDEQYALMDLIKQKHTFLNRAQDLINFFQLVQNIPNVIEKLGM